MSRSSAGESSVSSVFFPDEATPGRIHRIEVRRRPGIDDPRADAIARDARWRHIQPTSVRFAQVYLIRAALDEAGLERVISELLASPVLDEFTIGAERPDPGACVIEIHPKPGVMDPVALTVRDAIREITGVEDVEVMTGRRVDLTGVTPEQADEIGRRLLANPVVNVIHREPYHPDDFPRAETPAFQLTRVPIRDLDDTALEKLSRESHLFLSLEEMRAVRDEYRTLEREPTDIELETLAQTWSEHCVHKTLKSRIRYTGARDDDPIVWADRPGHTIGAGGVVEIDNLLRSTVAAATHELISEGVDWTLSVFVDNAGIIAFDESHAVCVKVETHNHPSAIEPYGGAATGIGGCIRDIIGAGMGARPIASTDVFCVAPPDIERIPEGCLHPRRTLTEVVAGVRDYGNRMGIPTLSGAVWFDDRYVGNPLVFCGCVGVMPRELISGEARPGDRIIALGGRTGRDGIHGATFSSAELTDTRADEFSHAVQIGNAIEEKKAMDAILRARDAEGGPLYSAITDCGAGGFSSAVGEMGEKLGAEVFLDRAPLKHDALTYTEIWISEAQERMVLSVPEENLERLQAICDGEGVEMSDLGVFGTEGADLILNYKAEEVGRLPMEFLHEGIPTPVREAEWRAAPEPKGVRASRSSADFSVRNALTALLSHPNIASKRWIVRQYDHEVQGATVVKPLVGPGGEGPGDASVVEPVPGSDRALAIGCGLATGVGDPAIGGDPYLMALAAIDETVRNLVCVGADPGRIAILDNFCWPSCGKPENLASLVRAAEGCYDGAKAYRTPFVSGKDSLNNQFTTEDGRTIEIPPTLLITGIGVVADKLKCVTSDAKQAGSALVLVGLTGEHLGGSHLQQALGASGTDLEALGASGRVPTTDLSRGPATARAVAGLIEAGLVRAAHDCSDGGLLIAASEMLIGAVDDSVPGRPGGIGLDIDLGAAPWMDGASRSVAAACFAENPSRYLLEIDPDDLERVGTAVGEIPHAVVGVFTDSGRLRVSDAGIDLPVDDLVDLWTAPLNW